MVADIVISANFSDSSSRILAGKSEDTLQETPLCVSDVHSHPLNAPQRGEGARRQVQNGDGDQPRQRQQEGLVLHPQILPPAQAQSITSWNCVV
jgi:hypothetical protein